MKKLSVVTVFFVVFLASCTVRKAQQNCQTSINSMAHGVKATDEIVAEIIPVEAEKYREESLDIVERIAEERRLCLETETPVEECPEETDQAVVFDLLMGRWERVVVAMEAIRSVLTLGQATLDLWVSSGTLHDGQWTEFCGDIPIAFQSLIDLLRVAGVDVPDQLQIAVRSSELVCGLIINLMEN